MKKQQTQPVKLQNPLNQEIWFCEDYKTTVNVDGVEYIKVFKEESLHRKNLMRKDALKIIDKYKSI